MARAKLNGGDFIRTHEQLKILINGIMRKAGFYTQMEARNIFHGLVEWEYLKEYLKEQVQKDAIIPDILVHNYPGDNNAHGNATVAAMFDIKTVRIDKRGVIYKVGVQGRRGGIDRAVKKKTKACQSNYLSRAKKLDEKYAPGDHTKPFQRAIQQTFASGNAIPLVFGAVGEFCVEGHRLVELLARYAAAKAENSDITPDKVSSAQRSPYNLYLSQFRRAIGCMAIRTAVEEKLRRVHLIRSSKAEANIAAQSGMGNHRQSSNSQAPAWFHNFRNEHIFDAFYRYRTHYDHFPSEYGQSSAF